MDLFKLKATITEFLHRLNVPLGNRVGIWSVKKKKLKYQKKKKMKTLVYWVSAVMQNVTNCLLGLL